MKGFRGEIPHQGLTNDWLTPKYIIDWFGKQYNNKLWFDLDPCASLYQRYKTATNQYTYVDNGLKKEWYGNVWMNPPYGSQSKNWIIKLIKHGRGVALLFARTETKLWQQYILPSCSAVLFLNKRVTFVRPDKTKARPATAPSALISWGSDNRTKLLELGKSTHYNQPIGCTMTVNKGE